MKKLVSFLMAIGLCLSLGACSSETQSSSTETNEEEQSVYGVQEVANVDDVEYTVTSVERSAGFSYNTPEEGKEYVIVTVNIQNNGDEKISYNPYDFRMLNSQGQEEDVTFVVDLENELSSGDLASGGNVSGKICFEEPAGDTGLQLNLYTDIFDEDPTCSFKLA